jgi:hypothetical protein
MKKILLAAQILLLPLHLIASLDASNLSDRTGTVEVSYFDNEPPPVYNYYKTSTELYFLDYEEGGPHDYTWDSSTGRVVDNTFNESIDYTFTSNNTGNFILYEDEGVDTGTFVSYDASWDLDYDGTPDGVQIEAGNQLGAGLTHPINLQSDADNDGLTLAQEGAYGTNPNAADSSGDGLIDGAVVSAGFNPKGDYSSLIAIVPNSTVDMILRSLRLERAENGAFNMNFDLEMSTDLQNWTRHSSESIEISVPDQSKTFMRLNIK